MHVRLIGIAAAIVLLAVGTIAAVSIRAGNDKSQTGKVNNSMPYQDNRTLRSKLAAQSAPVDSQTGQIRPLTPEEAQKLADGMRELVNQSDEGLTQVHHPDGSVSVDLEGRFQNVAVAQKNEDGTVSQSCVDNPESAAAFFGIDPEKFGVKTKAGRTTNSNRVPGKGEVK